MRALEWCELAAAEVCAHLHLMAAANVGDAPLILKQVAEGGQRKKCRIPDSDEAGNPDRRKARTVRVDVSSRNSYLLIDVVQIVQRGCLNHKASVSRLQIHEERRFKGVNQAQHCLLCPLPRGARKLTRVAAAEDAVDHRQLSGFLRVRVVE